jgi:hypothetical protein
MTYKSRIKKKFALENQKQKIKESNRTYFELKESKNRSQLSIKIGTEMGKRKLPKQ